MVGFRRPFEGITIATSLGVPFKRPKRVSRVSDLLVTMGIDLEPGKRLCGQNWRHRKIAANSSVDDVWSEIADGPEPTAS